jgi:hypothetical protein
MNRSSILLNYFWNRGAFGTYYSHALKSLTKGVQNKIRLVLIIAELGNRYVWTHYAILFSLMSVWNFIHWSFKKKRNLVTLKCTQVGFSKYYFSVSCKKVDGYIGLGLANYGPTTSLCKQSFIETQISSFLCIFDGYFCAKIARLNCFNKEHMAHYKFYKGHQASIYRL